MEEDWIVTTLVQHYLIELSVHPLSIGALMTELLIQFPWLGLVFYRSLSVNDMNLS